MIEKSRFGQNKRTDLKCAIFKTISERDGKKREKEHERKNL